MEKTHCRFGRHTRTPEFGHINKRGTWHCRACAWARRKHRMDTDPEFHAYALRMQRESRARRKAREAAEGAQ